MASVLLPLAALLSVAASADVTPAAAIEEYCEPLFAGSVAEQVRAQAMARGFQQQVVSGQTILIKGELLVSVSDSPRACFVQAPSTMTLEQGFRLADDWASRSQGALRSPATTGPDGAPVRGWSVPGKGLSLVATQQTAPTGRKVMAFIVMAASR